MNNSWKNNNLLRENDPHRGNYTAIYDYDVEDDVYSSFLYEVTSIEAEEALMNIFNEYDSAWSLDERGILREVDKAKALEASKKLLDFLSSSNDVKEVAREPLSIGEDAWTTFDAVTTKLYRAEKSYIQVVIPIDPKYVTSYEEHTFDSEEDQKDYEEGWGEDYYEVETELAFKDWKKGVDENLSWALKHSIPGWTIDEYDTCVELFEVGYSK